MHGNRWRARLAGPIFLLLLLRFRVCLQARDRNWFIFIQQHDHRPARRTLAGGSSWCLGRFTLALSHVARDTGIILFCRSLAAYQANGLFGFVPAREASVSNDCQIDECLPTPYNIYATYP